jgi:hypothetical protein
MATSQAAFLRRARVRRKAECIVALDGFTT